MDLYVLRHAIAVDRGHPDYLQDDSRRPLTRKGIRRMKRAVRGLRRAGLGFDLVLSSPYKRAWDTAAIVVEMLDEQERLEAFQPLAPEVPPQQTLRQLERRCGGLGSVLLVGHEPQLSALGSLLLSGDSGMALELGKAGAFKLEIDQFHPGAAILHWWLTPRQLRRLGR